MQISKRFSNGTSVEIWR